MTLGGLAAAIGLVIDDAIVVVENIVFHRDCRAVARLDAVRSALHEITVPLIGSTITPVVVFLPLVAVTGVTGSFFRALAITMTVALLTSLVLAAQLHSLRSRSRCSSKLTRQVSKQQTLRDHMEDARRRGSSAASWIGTIARLNLAVARPVACGARSLCRARSRHCLRVSLARL